MGNFIYLGVRPNRTHSDHRPAWRHKAYAWCVMIGDCTAIDPQVPIGPNPYCPSGCD